jgi:hypothetical protein
LPTRSVGPTDRSVGLLVGQTHLSGTGVSLVGGDPRVPISHSFPVVTDPDSGPPTLFVAQYKEGKDKGTTHKPPPPPHRRKPCTIVTLPAIQTEELDVGFYSPEARTSIKLPCPLGLAVISVCYVSITNAFLALNLPTEQINHWD